MEQITSEKYHHCLETLANPLRIKIIQALEKGPHSVSALTQKLGVERSRLSHSLEDLRKCKHVVAEKKGKQMIYSLNEKAMQTLPEHQSLFQVVDLHVKTFCTKECHKVG
jgi:DNA-binding transcriptional ArsR family regulator